MVEIRHLTAMKNSHQNDINSQINLLILVKLSRLCLHLRVVLQTRSCAHVQEMQLGSAVLSHVSLPATMLSPQTITI